jgi:nucleotide-binding universal stress UspA family protein
MRYVVATDGSEMSLKAARFLVRHFCPGPEDEIFAIYVFPLPSDPDCYSGVVALPRDADDERVRRVARPILDRTLQLLRESGGKVEEVLLVGNPAREIVGFATNLHVDLIVAGTHGRSTDTELYLGSVSSALTHRALCSVLIVR